MEHTIRQAFSVHFAYDVFFTEHMLDPGNPILADIVHSQRAGKDGSPKMLVIIDAGLAAANPGIYHDFICYSKHHGIDLVATPLIVPGGEAAKKDASLPEKILQLIDQGGICRHSYVVAAGGGAMLDMVGYAAATAHRGVRLIRVPTTVLAQNDAGIGVKNGINAFGKKNFIGTFKPPHAVINDHNFLDTLDMRDWRAGIAEAVKIALIRDADFFAFLENQAYALSAQDSDAMRWTVRRCAELHLQHIRTGGDPFEHGSARPLDFGHWAAHRLEHLTGYELKHGEAVAIGIALDSIYSHLLGTLDTESLNRILALLSTLGFSLCVPELDDPSLFEGLTQFREHLGGELTVTLLRSIGQGFEVHEIDQSLYLQGIEYLKQRLLAMRPAMSPVLNLGLAGAMHANPA